MKVNLTKLLACAVGLIVALPLGGAAEIAADTRTPLGGSVALVAAGPESSPIATRLALDLGVPLNVVPDVAAVRADSGDVVLVDAAWVASSGDEAGIVRALSDLYREGIIVVLIGSSIPESILELASLAGATHTGAGDGHIPAVTGFMMDPLYYAPSDDGGLRIVRQIGTEVVDFGNPQSLDIAAATLADWIRAGLEETEARLRGDLAGTYCETTGQPCTANHRDGSSQSWNQFYTFNYNSNDLFSPHGRHNYVLYANHLWGDGDSGDHYYNVYEEHQLVPGNVAYSNDWMNAWSNGKNDMDYYESANFIQRHGPPSADTSVLTVNFDVGVNTDPGGSINFGLSYSKAHVIVTDYSDNSIDLQYGHQQISYKDDVVESTASWSFETGGSIKDTNLGDTKFFHSFATEWVDEWWCGWTCGFDVYQTGDRTFWTNYVHTDT